MRLRRTLTNLAVIAAIAISSTAAGITAASASTINDLPDDTWMTNGIVYAIVRHGNYVYVGGKFTRVRAYNPATGAYGPSFAATNVARFDATTGVGDKTWSPDVTGSDTTTKVYALTVASDGQLWIGGKFQAVDGQPRRNLAVVSTAVGAATVSPIAPVVGSETSQGVRALNASGSRVYVGGLFANVDGKARKGLAALSPAGVLDPVWKPKVDGQARSLQFACDGQTIFASGNFRNASGSDGVFSPRETIARFDVVSGALDPWAIPADTVPNGEVAADLAVTCQQVSAGFLGRNYARSFSLTNGNVGSQLWALKNAGDVQTVAVLGDRLILGGHFSQIEDLFDVCPQDCKRTRIASVDLATGRVSADWAPSVQGQFYGPWDLLVDGNRLYVGGAFTEVESGGIVDRQTMFARFTFSP